MRLGTDGNTTDTEMVGNCADSEANNVDKTSSTNVVGFGVEDEAMYSNCYAYTYSGTIIPPDRIRNLGDGRWMMLWEELEDSTVVYLVVCGSNDEARWLSLRPPQPCETVMQRQALRELIHGLTLSQADVMMMTGEDDGN